MNEEDRAKYLANIYHVLIADGGMDRVEERVFEDIRRDLRAGYTDTRKAKELAQQDPDALAKRLNTKITADKIRRNRWIEQAQERTQPE